MKTQDNELFDKGYAVVPIQAITDNRLSSTQVRLLSMIMVLQMKKKYCFASNGYFSKTFELSKTQVSNLIKGLYQAGYISIEYIRGTGTKEIKERRIYLGTGNPEDVSIIWKQETIEKENKPSEKAKIENQKSGGNGKVNGNGKTNWKKQRYSGIPDRYTSIYGIAQLRTAYQELKKVFKDIPQELPNEFKYVIGQCVIDKYQEIGVDGLVKAAQNWKRKGYETGKAFFCLPTLLKSDRSWYSRIVQEMNEYDRVLF